MKYRRFNYMQTNDTVFFVVLMFVSGIGIGGITIQVLNDIKIKQIIEPCEKRLPRDQHCEILAVPILKEQK